MKRFRQFARVIATVWLVCQAASVAAFVPGSCCAAHAVEAAAKPEACHETEPAPEPGAACPMHHGDHSESDTCCAMTNACDSPSSPLAQLFAFVGLLEAPDSAFTLQSSAAPPAGPSARPLYRLVRPDAPPPKG
jgi:hypothetical protein